MAEESVLSGAEPFFLKGNETGVLLSHGFTGTTQSVRYLGEALNRAGYTVSAPRLPGHGVSPAAMAKSTARDWIGAVEDGLGELRARCKRVFIGGLSMGGTLTLYIAGKHADKIAGAFSINACLHTDNPDLAVLAFERQAPPTIPALAPDIKDPETKVISYPEIPVTSFREFLALLAATRELLPRVICPTLIIQSRQDHLVPPGNARTIASLIGARRAELLWLDNSYHVATLDYDKDVIATEVRRFIASV